MNTRFAYVILLTSFILVSFPLAAGTSLEIRPLVGYNGIFQSDGIVPVKFFIRNESSDIEGTFRVVTSGTRPGMEPVSTSYIQEVILPRNSYKSYSFLLPAEQMDTVRYIIEKDGIELFSEEIEPKSIQGMDNLVLVLSRTIAFDFLSRLGNAGNNYLVYMRPDILPDSWLGYNQASALIIHNIPLGELSPEQLEAIDNWNKNGGTVAVIGGTHFGTEYFRTLNGLLPVELIPGRPAMVNVNNAVFSDYNQSSSFSLNDIDLTSLNVSIKEGRILGKSGSIPLLTAAPRGAGKIIFSSVDFTRDPLRNWDKRNNVWDSLMPPQRIPEMTMLSENDFSDTLLNELLLEEDQAGKISSYFLLILFPFILALLAFFLFRRKVVVYVSLFCILLGVLGIFILENYRQPAASVYKLFSIIEMSGGSAYGNGTHHVMLASSRTAEYSLHVREKDVFTADKSSEGDIFLHQNSVDIESILISKWNSFSYLFKTAEVFHYESRISEYGTGKRITIKNLDSRPLTGGVFIYRGRLYETGNLGPGEEVSRIFYGINPIAAISPSNTWKTIFSADPDREIKIAVFEQVLEYNKFDYLYDGNIITFAGWMDSGSLDITPNVPFNDSYSGSIVFISVDLEDNI